jgi:hypothetical protein
MADRVVVAHVGCAERKLAVVLGHAGGHAGADIASAGYGREIVGMRDDVMKVERL